MTRNGKIARLPVAIREELNRRIENGEQGVRLVEWLNTLPEVKAVVQTDFEGVAITEMNLSYWKNGGFLDWQAQQRAEAVIERWVESPMSNAQSPKSEKTTAMVGALTNALMAHYAAALEDSNAMPEEDPKARVERLGRSLKDMSRLRRDELAGERLREHVRIEEEWVAIERQRAELERERLELQRATQARAANTQARGAITEADAERERQMHLEKAEMVKEMVREAKEADEKKRSIA